MSRKVGLKKVGASGQILLGEQYAGKRFNVIAHPDNRLELIPVPDSAVASAQLPGTVDAPDGWLPPGGYDGCTQWTLDNRAALEQYARQVEEEGTAAEQLQRFLSAHPEMLVDDHGKI